MSLELARAAFVGHAVAVSAHNFPQIHSMLEKAKAELSYTGNVEVYIVEEGSVNALIAKFFSTKFIVLHSGMAESLDTSEGRRQLEFIVARFVGALKAKHLKLNALEAIVNGLEKMFFLNLFILPYERAVQYSGDQIGLAVCRDLQDAVRALTRMMVGNKLSGEVNPAGILRQAQSVTGLFGIISNLLSSHPHMVHRYMNLLAFARCRYPSLYEEYVAGFRRELRTEMEHALDRLTVHRPRPAPTRSLAPGSAVVAALPEASSPVAE
jgi:hypothetical protein